MAIESEDHTCGEYESIKSILDRFRINQLEKYNVYGIVTFIYEKPKCTCITIVDDSCGLDDKLKLNVFKDEKRPYIEEVCQVGDIVRFHRIKVQEFNGNAQGVVFKFCSWITFKRDSTDYLFESKNTTSTINDYDKNRVKELRNWLKTNPQNNALYEADLSKAVDLNDTAFLTTHFLNQASNTMNMIVNKTISSTADNNSSLAYFKKNSPFSSITQFGYFDIVCQLCAVCSEVSGIKFMIAWDSTKSKSAVFQENQFELDFPGGGQELDEHSNTNILYSKSIRDFIVHFYVFDEFVPILANLKPGDYILLKNAKACSPPTNSGTDFLFKMPGVINKNLSFNRSITKLASYADLEASDFAFPNKEIEAIIKSIHQKGKELGVKFMDKDVFFSEYQPTTSQFDDTLHELVKEKGGSKKSSLSPKKQSEIIAAKKPETSKKSAPSALSQVENLLADQESKYMTDDESSSEEEPARKKMSLSPQKKSNIENTNNTMSLRSSPRKQTVITNAESNSKKTPENTSTKQRSISLSPQKLTVSDQNDNNKRLSASPTKRKSTQLTKTPIKTTSSSDRTSDSPARKSIRLSASPIKSSTIITSTLVEEMDSEEVVLKETETNNTSKDENAKIDPFQISEDIFKFKRLANLTYFVPFMQKKAENPNDLAFIPFFNSLEYLAKEAANRDQMKCKVVAKLFNYSVSTCPSIASVFVHCKKCDYINFTPFHLANIYHSSTLSFIINDLALATSSLERIPDTSTQMNNNNNQTTGNTQDLADDLEIDQDQSYNQAINFNFNWLETAMPTTSQTIQYTQAMTQNPKAANYSSNNNQQQDNILYKYHCPRCLLTMNSESEEFCDDLDFMYRFWFVLRDASSRLNPCLLEGEFAEKFLENIAPIKFYTNQTKSHQVYKIIHKNFNKKFLFTIETFKCGNSNSKKTATTPNNNNNNNSSKAKSVDVLYKIVDMEEIVSI